MMKIVTTGRLLAFTLTAFMGISAQGQQNEYGPHYEVAFEPNVQPFKTYPDYSSDRIMNYPGDKVVIETASNSFLESSASSLKMKADVGNDQMYKINWAVDGPVTGVGTAWTMYAFSRIYDKDPSPVADIEKLDKNDINGFDRWAAGMHSDEADKNSNYLFYGSVAFPFLLLADKEIRKDAPRVGLLYLESMAITGLLYTSSTYFLNRYRPETYRTDIPPSERTDGNYRNAFFAGHVALVATASFFTAQVYADYHPTSSLKWVLYGGAAAATITTAYLRHIAGKHFPSDIIVGTAVGTLSGILVPLLHKNKRMEDRAWRVSPHMNSIGFRNNMGSGYGLSLTYRL